MASCRGTPTTSDLVATHGSGLRRYVPVERPKAQLVRPGRDCYAVSEVDRDAILLLTRHAASTTHRRTLVRDKARPQVCTHEPLKAATNSKSPHPRARASTDPGGRKAPDGFVVPRFESGVECTPAATDGGAPEPWEAFNRRYFADK